jgi:hypothetical protein
MGNLSAGAASHGSVFTLWQRLGYCFATAGEFIISKVRWSAIRDGQIRKLHYTAPSAEGRSRQELPREEAAYTWRFHRARKMATKGWGGAGAPEPDLSLLKGSSHVLRR